ncbi:PopZ family protein [Ancylobacter terrae]|uniref:PopZ family protein n=1 Tax=Ancylobacter sp. sgz301288 TaxID=3342077 RepID=UPI00385B9CAD
MSMPARSSDTSMEEILASIRRIIADDAPRAAQPRFERAAGPRPLEREERREEPRFEPEPAPAAHVDVPRDLAPLEAPDDEPDYAHEEVAAVASELARVESEVRSAIREGLSGPVRVTETAAFIDTPAAAHLPDSGRSAAPAPEASYPRGPFDPAAPRAGDREPLVSPPTNAAVAASFGTLARTIMNNNTRSLEDVVAELLRPMLRSWLDDNLPGVVERLVRAEIERVARGGR